MVGKYKIIALCISRIHENFSHDFVLRFSHILKNTDYRLFVYNACSDLSNIESSITAQRFTYDLIDYSVVDVLVVYEDRIRNQEISDEIIAKGLQHNVPVIVLGAAHPGCINIASDDPRGMEKMVRHLIEEHGVRKLHFIAGIPNEPYSDARIAAFRRILDEKKIPFYDSMVSYGQYWSGPTEEVVERLVTEKMLPEAFVCVNDPTALTTCSVLKRHGIKIPDEVKVTGFDGSLDTMISRPTVSTVNCSIQEYAEQTLRAIDLAMQGVREKTILFEPELWKFESCGCGKEDNYWEPEYILTLKDSLYRFQSDNLRMAQVSANIQRCENPQEVAKAMMQRNCLFDIHCLVEKDFLDEETTLAEHVASDVDKKYILLFDSEEEQPFVPRSFNKDEICPNLPWLLEDGRTILFCALTYLDIFLGYLCFSFDNLNLSALLRIPQISTYVGAGIGGYINLRHEHYLNNTIEEMYRVDSLTGLFNRRGFSVEYEKMLAQKSDNEPLTVVLADVDELKHINDSYGHAAGDIAISTVAKALLYACPYGAVSVRFGGDEMMAVCLGEHDVEEIQFRFYHYLKRFNRNKTVEYDINASVGIYTTEPSGKPGFEELITHADQLMYIEKQKRKADRAR